MAEESTHSARLYWLIFVILLGWLALTIGLSYVDFGRKLNGFIAISIACIKAVLILLFFMHLRWRDWLTWFFAGAGFIWLSIMLILTATDYVTRNRPAHDSPKGEPVFLQPYASK